jgi:hypothetical protein
MSWRRVAIIYAVFALLAAWVFLLGGDAPNPEAPVAVPPAASILDVDAATVTTLTLRKDGRVVRASRTDDRWSTTEPSDAKVPPDLFAAMVATLTAGQAAEELSHEPESASALAVYGLASPVATLEVVLRDGAPPITVAIGDQNPTRTAVYARRSDRPTIYLVGMNLRYYIDLVFEAAGGHAAADRPRTKRYG